MTEQLAEKRDDLGARDVVNVKIEVQPESTATRRHRECGDNGNSVPSVAMPKTRSPPDGRPGLADVGDEQKAALIEECEMSASARGVFLTWAILPASTSRSHPRRAGGRAVPAFANSSGGCDVTAPTRRATSRYGVPACSSSIAWRRRFSNCSAVPDGLMGDHRSKHMATYALFIKDSIIYRPV